MGTYRKNPVIVEASQWHQNGDHPLDESRLLTASTGEPFYSEGQVVRRYRHPQIKGGWQCELCGAIMHIHGWIDNGKAGYTICPGDWVVTENGAHYPVKDSVFHSMFTEVE